MRRKIIRALAVVLTALSAIAIRVPVAHAAWVGPAGNSLAPALHGYPTAIAPDGSGGALVAFQGLPIPGGHAIRLLRVLADGTVPAAWPAGGAVACSLALTPSLGRMRAVTDGLGGAFVVWNEGSILSGPGAAFVQHLQADGSRSPGWPAPGRALVAGSSISSFQALSDGAGGVIVVWASNGTIRSMRIRANSTNAAGYPVTGRVLLAPPVVGGGVPNTFSFAPTNDGGFWLGAAVISADTLSIPSSYRLLRLDAGGGIDLNWLGDGSGLELPVASSALVNAGACVHADGGGGALMLAQLGDHAMVMHVLADQTPDPDWPAPWLDLGTANGVTGLTSSIEPDGGSGWYVVWPQAFFADQAAVRHVLGSGILDPVWPADLLLQPDYQPTLVGGPSGPYLGGTFLYTCPHQNCLGLSEIAHRSPQGAVPSGWPAAAGVADAGAYPLPDSSFGGIIGMIPDGAGGVFASWTVPDVLSNGYGSPGTLRVMRFVDAGPVAGVIPHPADAALTLTRARYTREGIRAVLSGTAGARARLEVFDVLGRRATEAELPLGSQAVEVLVPGTASQRPGLYLLRLSAGGSIARAKVVVTR